jgi:hypothetical protein
MTLIWGINESGKSTWHAAIYAGLCGIRRTRGRGREEDVDFARRHRPWTSDEWKVSLTLTLADGRKIDLSRDLEGRVDCRATDAVLGRDVSSEIMVEGAPDGSHWLGLDRRSFLAIACVRQAELLAVQDDPESLQVYLQKAAATAGTDATAAAALERIDEFQREHVGQDRVNATKPLRRANERFNRAKARLEHARSGHASFLELAARARGLSEEAEAAERRLRLAEATVADRDAARLKSKLARARELAVRYPDGPPPGFARDDELAHEVSAALAGWESRPEIPVLAGTTAEELRTKIAALPRAPEGDLVPHASVCDAREGYVRAQQALEIHRSQRPPEVPTPTEVRLSIEDIHRLAFDLDTPIPDVDPALEGRARVARERLDGGVSKQRRLITSLTGAIAIAGGAAAVLFGHTLLGIGLVVAGALALVAMALLAGASASDSRADDWRRAEAELVHQKAARQTVMERRERALDRTRQAHLPEDPDSLRELAQRLGEYKQSRDALERWVGREMELQTDVETAAAKLKTAFQGRGLSDGHDLEETWQSYEAACSSRAAQAEQAERRGILEVQHANRIAAEEAVQQATKTRVDARTRLLAVAATCGPHADEEEAFATIRSWQKDRATRLQQHEQMVTEWTEFQNLLEGRTLERFEAEVTQRSEEAKDLAVGLGVSELAQALAANLGEREVAELRKACAKHREAATETRTRSDEAATRIDSVAEAEEALAAAEAELARVRSLDEVLTQTRAFLEEAETRVHRDIARVLADTIRPWLAPLTAGRYSDVLVDPESLEVKVLDPTGTWRSASLLSYGTSEQIYLLLRTALATHLGNRKEGCPLILDDVTTHCDRQRTAAMLSLLHQLSHERQVILFSQEDDVLAWGRATLRAPEDRLVELHGRELQVTSTRT